MLLLTTKRMKSINIAFKPCINLDVLFGPMSKVCSRYFEPTERARCRVKRGAGELWREVFQGGLSIIQPQSHPQSVSSALAIGRAEKRYCAGVQEERAEEKHCSAVLDLIFALWARFVSRTQGLTRSYPSFWMPCLVD